MDALRSGIAATGLESVESPIGGLVRAVTPLVLQDLRVEDEGALMRAG